MTDMVELIEVNETHITVHRWWICEEGCLSESVQYFPAGEVRILKTARLKADYKGVNSPLKSI
jgi:hypothetical protein